MMASFESLPAELVLEIGEYLVRIHKHDLGPLVRVNRMCHVVLTPLLYHGEGCWSAAEWAVDNGSIPVLEAVVVRYKIGDEDDEDCNYFTFNATMHRLYWFGYSNHVWPRDGDVGEDQVDWIFAGFGGELPHR